MRRLILAVVAFLLFGAIPVQAQSYLTVKDHPGDDGDRLDLTIHWDVLHNRYGQDIDSIQLYRRTGDSEAGYVAALKPADSIYADENLKRDTAYTYAAHVFTPSGMTVAPSGVEPVAPVASLFNPRRINALILMLVFCTAVLLYIRAARSGKADYIRPLPGLEAVEDGVGRATEMGKPVLFIPGTGDIDDVQTLAGLSVLSKIAKITATYETPLMVPCLYPMPLAAAEEVVQQSYIDAGKSEAFSPDMVRYMAGESFGFAAAVNGWMMREKPATNIFLGNFAAESLLLAETGNAAGAIQIAGTAQPEQLPFFIAACDYTLLGEELYAASAYLSKEPKFLGSLKAQDLFKIILALLILAGAVMYTFDLPWAETFRSWFMAI